MCSRLKKGYSRNLSFQTFHLFPGTKCIFIFSQGVIIIENSIATVGKEVKLDSHVTEEIQAEKIPILCGSNKLLARSNHHQCRETQQLVLEFPPCPV